MTQDLRAFASSRMAGSYASASEHNQVRAQSQVRLAKSIQAQWHSIQNVVLSNVNLV